MESLGFRGEKKQPRRTALSEALDIHHKSEMMKEIAELRDKYHLHMKVEMFNEA